MTAKFCRDCANFEERRDIDWFSLCAQLNGPYTCCEEFELRDKTLNERKMYNRFCVECTNFEEIKGNPICTKGHFPGTACEAFVERFEKLKTVRQNNQAKTAILVYTLTHSADVRIPDFLREVCPKIKW